eukprot:2390144-Pleurochrysis_carterae.AAC.3
MRKQSVLINWFSCTLVQRRYRSVEFVPCAHVQREKAANGFKHARKGAPDFRIINIDNRTFYCLGQKVLTAKSRAQTRSFQCVGCFTSAAIVFGRACMKGVLYKSRCKIAFLEAQSVSNYILILQMTWQKCRGDTKGKPSHCAAKLLGREL